MSLGSRKWSCSELAESAQQLLATKQESTPDDDLEQDPEDTHLILKGCNVVCPYCRILCQLGAGRS